MKRCLRFKYETSLEFDRDVTNHMFVLKLKPAESPMLSRVSASIAVLPYAKLNGFTDGFGNSVLSGGILPAHNYFNYSVEGKVEFSENENAAENNGCLAVYKYQTRFTEPSAAMREWSGSLNLGRNLESAEKLCGMIYNLFAYKRFVTDIRTTAEQAFDIKAGVCQDYTHVFLSIARLNGIPSRYVSGLHIGEGFSHAWAEVFINGQWRGFDPTNNRAVNRDYIKICSGRDFGDCQIERGVFAAPVPVVQRQTVFAKVFEI